MKTRILVAVLALLSVVAIAPAQGTMSKKPMMKKGTMMKKAPVKKG